MSNFSKRNIPSSRGLSKASLGTYSYLDNFDKDIQPLQKTLSSEEGRSRVRTLLSRGTSAPIEKKFRVADVEKKFQQYGYIILNRLFVNDSLHPTHYLLSTKHGDEFILEMDQAEPFSSGQVILSTEVPPLHLCRESTYASSQEMCTTKAFEEREKRLTVSALYNIDDITAISFTETPRGFVYPIMKEAEMFPHVGDVIDITEKVAHKVDKVIYYLFCEIVKITDTNIIPELNRFIRQLEIIRCYSDMEDYISSELQSLIERVQLLTKKEKSHISIYEKRKVLRKTPDVTKLRENYVQESTGRESFNNATHEFYNLRLDEIIDDLKEQWKSREAFNFYPPNIQRFLEKTSDLL